tara:strand:- start:1485 stop:1760 length:276 start_codon:yes stop_codon:yes gene_type:complete
LTIIVITEQGSNFKICQVGFFTGEFVTIAMVTKKSLEIRSTLGVFAVGNKLVFYKFLFYYIMITIVFTAFLRKNFFAIFDFGHLLNVHFAI